MNASNSLFRVCLIFYTYDSTELQKASGITPWKNATRYCAGPAYYRMPRRLLFKQTGSRKSKETITHHLFLELGRRKLSDAAKICGGAGNVVKTETQQTFRNGLLGFITLGIYTPLEARVLPQ